MDSFWDKTILMRHKGFVAKTNRAVWLYETRQAAFPAQMTTETPTWLIKFARFGHLSAKLTRLKLFKVLFRASRQSEASTRVKHAATDLKLDVAHQYSLLKKQSLGPPIWKTLTSPGTSLMVKMLPWPHTKTCRQPFCLPWTPSSFSKSIPTSTSSPCRKKAMICTALSNHPERASTTLILEASRPSTILSKHPRDPMDYLNSKMTTIAKIDMWSWVLTAWLTTRASTWSLEWITSQSHLVKQTTGINTVSAEAYLIKLSLLY